MSSSKMEKKKMKKRSRPWPYDIIRVTVSHSMESNYSDKHIEMEDGMMICQHKIAQN